MNAESYGTVLRELGTSTVELINSEISLVKAEFKQTADKLGSRMAQAVLFAGLLAVSTIPFLAFLVIGLGEILNDNYWLSSLIVSIVCASIGGIFAYRSIQKLKQEDLTMGQAQDSLRRGIDIVREGAKEVKDAATN